MVCPYVLWARVPDIQHAVMVRCESSNPNEIQYVLPTKKKHKNYTTVLCQQSKIINESLKVIADNQAQSKISRDERTMHPMHCGIVIA